MDALQITKLLTNSKTVVGAINELYNKIKSSNGGIFYLGNINKDSISEQILEAIGGNWDNFIEKINGDYILLYRGEEYLNRMPLYWSYENGNKVNITFWDRNTTSTFNFLNLCITKNDTTYTCEETEYNTLVGDITKLQTTNKNIVDAINEIYNSISAQTGIYRISELTTGMQSEDISSAIGGWDNLLEAINDKRTILMYSGSTVYQAIYYNNITITISLKFITPNTGNTNSELNYINIGIANISGNLTINRTQTPINTEDITKLQTDTKNLVGAINELNGKIGTTDGLPYVIIKPNSYVLLQTLWYEGTQMGNTEILDLFGIESSASDANQKLFDLVSSFKDKSLILFKQKDNDSADTIAASALGLIANLFVAENSIELTLNIITGSETGNDDAPIVCNILFQINTTNKRIVDAINEINTKLNNIVHVKVIEFENLKSITDDNKANTVMSKYTMEEIIFAQANGIPFINKQYDAGGTSNRDIILRVGIGTNLITFIYFNDSDNKFHTLALTYDSETKKYTFLENVAINN